ncbi:MAG TPA: XRE family transcriptional regulator [Acidimicrobiales bacterium]|jgi:transcriptional regulator with XRE-family HTH domain|nr:XRE family transcriptional regulator [Acidimicrobiales bacterium]
MELDAVLTSIAEGLREERIRAGLTLEQLALRSDLSIAHLSRLESGDRQPSIAALITLSRALGISMSALLGEGKGGSALAIYDENEPTHVANGLAVSACSGFPGSSNLEALRIIIETDRVPPPFAQHRGEEWIHVVRGRLRLEYADETHYVACGASAHFDAEQPHRLGAEGTTTEVLIVAVDAPQDLRNRPLFPSSTSGH